MSIPGCLVIQRPAIAESPGSWELIAGDQFQVLDAGTPLSELASAASSIIGDAEIKNAHVVIAPSSKSCYFVKLIPSDDIEMRDRSALTYELEDHLPIDAESMVADFVAIESTSDDAKACGALAVPVQPWLQIVDAFESADLPVRSIVPAAVLETRTLSDETDANETVRWLLIDGPHCDCISTRGETILSWNHLSTDGPALKRQLLLDRSNIDRTVVVGADASELESVRSIQPDLQTKQVAPGELVQQGARLLLDNRSQRWFDLRRDQLGPTDPLRAIGKQLRWVSVAAALCFLAFAIGGWWRSSWIEQEITRTQNEQNELFREAFPGSRVSAVLRRVRSEHTRVRGSRGQNPDVEVPVSATKVLRELLTGLPEDVKFKIASIDIQSGNAQVDLAVQKFPHIDTIVDALSARGFVVPDPGFSRDVEDTNQYTTIISATWAGADAAQDAIAEEAE